MSDIQQGPKKISGGYDADDFAFLDDRRASDLVGEEQARRLLDADVRPDRDRIRRHCGIHLRAIQVAPMVTQVTIAQNSHKFAVLDHHDVAKTFSAHPHFAAARVWSGLTELGSGLIRSSTRMLMCRRLCSVRFLGYSRHVSCQACRLKCGMTCLCISSMLLRTFRFSRPANRVQHSI